MSTVHNWLLLEKLVRQQSVFYKDYNLSRYEFDVLECVALHFNPRMDQIFPKQATIANITGVHLSNVSRAIKHFEKEGLITSSRSKNNRKQYKFTEKLFSLLDINPSEIKKPYKPKDKKDMDVPNTLLDEEQQKLWHRLQERNKK